MFTIGQILVEARVWSWLDHDKSDGWNFEIIINNELICKHKICKGNSFEEDIDRLHKYIVHIFNPLYDEEIQCFEKEHKDIWLGYYFFNKKVKYVI